MMTTKFGNSSRPVAATWTRAAMGRSIAALTSTKKRATHFIAALALVGVAASAQAQTEQKPEDIAERAYLYGLQQAIYYGQRWIYTQNDAAPTYSGLNRLFWVRKQITPDFPIVTPNATTLYGTGFLDLRDGPVIIEVPEITDRYFSVQIMDPYGLFRVIVGSPSMAPRPASTS